VLAAGEGRRFGGRKQLAELHGRPLLEHVLSAMAATPLERVVVVLGANADEVLSGVDLYGAEPVVFAAWHEGQAASLRAGLDALGDVAGAVVALGDQPRLSPLAVERLLSAPTDGFDAARATYAGKPGHPVLLRRSLFPAVRQLSGDEGARGLLEHARVASVACDGLGGPEDVDTRDELEELNR